MRQIHYLKTWPEPFQATKDGLKNFEIREFDRGFKVTDLLVLEEFNATAKTYTGQRIVCTITHIVPPGVWGLRGEVGVLGTRETTKLELVGVALKPPPKIAKR